MSFPLVLTASGIFVCIATSFVATDLWVVSSEKEIEPSLKRQVRLLCVALVLQTATDTELLLAWHADLGVDAAHDAGRLHCLLVLPAVRVRHRRQEQRQELVRALCCSLNESCAECTAGTCSSA